MYSNKQCRGITTMSEVRFKRFVLVWEGANYCAASEYTPDEYHQAFDKQERTQLLAGYEVDCLLLHTRSNQT